MYGHLFINHKNQKKRKRMDFKNAVKALQIGKRKGRKKFRLSTEFGKNPEEEPRFRNIRVRRCAGENWTNLNGW